MNINTEIEFILSTIKNWNSAKYLRYAYDKISGFHIIEVDGVNDDDILDLYMRFMDAFPDSDLLIDQESDVNDMKNLIYEK